MFDKYCFRMEGSNSFTPIWRWGGESILYLLGEFVSLCVSLSYLPARTPYVMNVTVALYGDYLTICSNASTYWSTSLSSLVSAGAHSYNHDYCTSTINICAEFLTFVN